PHRPPREDAHPGTARVPLRCLRREFLHGGHQVPRSQGPAHRRRGDGPLLLTAGRRASLGGVTMRHDRRRLMVLACVAGVALAAARPARLAAKGPSEAELLKRIEKGGTAGDHEALAAYYGDQAKAAAKKASEHEAMADKYANVMGKTDWPRTAARSPRTTGSSPRSTTPWRSCTARTQPSSARRSRSTARRPGRDRTARSGPGLICVSAPTSQAGRRPRRDRRVHRPGGAR